VAIAATATKEVISPVEEVEAVTEAAEAQPEAVAVPEETPGEEIPKAA
jgi:hypothetical protein